MYYIKTFFPKLWYTLYMPKHLRLNEEALHGRKPRARYDEFADQFTSGMYEHWSDILQIINRQSRVAALLRAATPSQFKTSQWHMVCTGHDQTCSPI